MDPWWPATLIPRLVATPECVAKHGAPGSRPGAPHVVFRLLAAVSDVATTVTPG